MEVSLAEKLPMPSIGEVLGYLAPGSAFLAVVFLAEGWASAHKELSFHTPLHTAASLLGQAIVGSAGAEEHGYAWPIGVILLLGVALVAYALGHVIDSIGKLVIDRILVFKGYGYPYQHLLNIRSQSQRDEGKRIARGIEHATGDVAVNDAPVIRAQRLRATPEWSHFSAAFYRGVFFWLNVYLAVRWYALFRSVSGGTPAHAHTLMLVADVIGIWWVALVALKILLGQAMRNYLFARQLNGTISNDEHHGVRLLFKATTLAVNGLYDRLSQSLAKVLNTQRSFDTTFQLRYKSAFRRMFDFDPETAESNNYWLTYAFVVSKSPAAASLLTRYRQLYHFSRNLGVALWISVVYVLSWYHFAAARPPARAGEAAANLLVVLPAIAGISTILVVHFYYLYVCYYSKFLFRAFVFLTVSNDGTGVVSPHQQHHHLSER